MSRTEPENTADVETKRLRSRVQSLERNVDNLQSLIVGAAVLVAAVLLGLGSFGTVAVNLDGEVESWGVLSAPIRLWGTLDNAENVGFTLLVVLLSALLGLAVLVTLFLCIPMGQRGGGPRLLVLAKVLTVVLAIGLGTHGLLGLGAAASDAGALGPALYYFAPGVGLFALLTFRDTLQSLWMG